MRAKKRHEQKTQTARVLRLIEAMDVYQDCRHKADLTNTFQENDKLSTRRPEVLGRLIFAH